MRQTDSYVKGKQAMKLPDANLILLGQRFALPILFQIVMNARQDFLDAPVTDTS